MRAPRPLSAVWWQYYDSGCDTVSTAVGDSELEWSHSGFLHWALWLSRLIEFNFLLLSCHTVRGTYNHKFEWGNLENAKAFLLQKTPYFWSTSFIKQKKSYRTCRLLFFKIQFPWKLVGFGIFCFLSVKTIDAGLIWWKIKFFAIFIWWPI